MVYFVIGLIIGLLVLFFVAGEFQEIAEMKGHEGKKYFWWTFLTGFVGMLMVIALPDRKAPASVSQPSRPQAYSPVTHTPAAPAARPTPAAAPASAPAPASAVPKPEKKTRKPVAPIKLENGLEQCPACQTVQYAYRAFCKACDAPFYRSAPAPAAKPETAPAPAELLKGAIREEIAYALRFKTEDGMMNYLKNCGGKLSANEKAELNALLSGPEETLRQRLRQRIGDGTAAGE